ncbi:fused MFS/spermidine synthase, partial [Candidatus Sumerlaeota bacterium]|nr:fused MFS/spermidine synthase [Candidatus Sumerlaeota bacterium]
ATVGCAALLALYFAAAPQWDTNVLCSGIYRQRGRLPSFKAMLDMLAERDAIAYYKDGVDASIAVVDSQGSRSLLINGKPDASDSADMSTQILLSHYPLLTRPNCREALVIGLGSGVSVGSALKFPVEHVDVVEISSEVKEAAIEYFADVNSHFADDPRVTIHLEDAKTFLQVTPKVYDVIISEPTNPWIAGVAGLFSKEFFQTCREHLAPDGLVIQWMHVYELEDAALMSVLRTFTDAFPYFVIWNMNRYDIALMGSPGPFTPDFAWMEKQVARAEVAGDLKRIGIEHPLALLDTQMFVSTTEPSDLFRHGIVNSDIRPYLEYSAPVGFFAGSHALGIKSLDMRAWTTQTRSLWIDQYRPAQPPTSEQFASFHGRWSKIGSLCNGEMADWADRWRDAYPDDPKAIKASIESRSDRPDWQQEQLRSAIARFPNDAGLADLQARVLCRLLENNGRDRQALASEARNAIERAQALNHDKQWPHQRLLLTVAYHEGQMREVLKLGPAVLPRLSGLSRSEGSDSAFAILQMICEAAVACSRRDVAEHCLKEARQILPDGDLRLRRLESLRVYPKTSLSSH